LTNPIVTLTTDYGTSDHLVGVLKGVILKINPEVQIVDITHQVAPFDLLDGALAIASAYSYFPPRTIHVVVVDPGVGTEFHRTRQWRAFRRFRKRTEFPGTASDQRTLFSAPSQ
jgi:S-adenosylmethionine hydrolase